jgi:hypothetical protein
MGYEELLETLRARNIVRAEWTVYYYYNDEDTSEGGTLSFADGSTTPFDYDTEEDIYEALVYDVSCDGRLSDTAGVFVLDAASGIVERAADVFFDFEQELDDEEEGIEKDEEEYMTVTPLPHAEQDRLKLTE